MSKLLLIDGNSILNRAFYGIMGSKMLMTNDGTYTNAVYGFLAIMFKTLEEINPEYLTVTFDLKAPTHRHMLYKEYKGTRKGMPNELAEQLPIIKEILKAMNINIIEKEGYEADDIIGTLSLFGEDNGLEVIILSGDRDNFQLASDKTIIRIPRTKGGKTETEEFDKNKIIETYGVEPKQLIEVKGLQGDTSDNIPGVPGIGEKTALNLIKEYKTIENLYKKIENETTNIKGKLKDNLINNKDLALLSRTLGTIDRNAPIEKQLTSLKKQEWNKPKVLEWFKKLNFNRYIERFNLKEQENVLKNDINFEIKEINDENQIKELIENIIEDKQIIYYFDKIFEENSEDILKSQLTAIYIFNKDNIFCYSFKNNKDEFIKYFKEIFENKEIKKISYKEKEQYILLRQIGVEATGFYFDIEIAAYLLNPTKSEYSIEELSDQYIELDIDHYVNTNENKTINKQITLFEELNENQQNLSIKNATYVYCIEKLYKILEEELEKTNQLELFRNIEMPVLEVLGDMQYVGIYVDKKELIEYGDKLKAKIEVLTKEIYEISGEDFNINSTKQLGNILFEKLKLPVYKKTKSGYSTDVDVLEKLRKEHPIIEKLLEYRQLMKLNSTYVEGLMPYINNRDDRIHSYFNQTVTATGRISSNDPNLQNIPTRFQLGKQLRKVFKPKDNFIFIDADYSQIELRLLSHISEDEHMIEAFKNNEDIHKNVASKVFGIPLDEVSKEQRSAAKAVNFGIVYGISDFGLAEQLDISKKQAKLYIDQYLEQYNGIKDFMNNIIEQAKQDGYVETLFHRRRYLPELSSNNYMVRQFGARAAMNTPIQGTAADIMKIAMINVFNELKSRNMKSKIVLQIHDELLIEASEEEKEEVKKILKNGMETAILLKVPLIAEMSEANNWYESK